MTHPNGQITVAPQYLIEALQRELDRCQREVIVFSALVNQQAAELEAFRCGEAPAEPTLAAVPDEHHHGDEETARR